MKTKIWSSLWPLALFLVSFWLFPILTAIYVLIGMVVKVGQIVSVDRSNDKEPEFLSVFGYIVEAYTIVVWPKYFKGTGYRGAVKVIGGCLLLISLVFGVFYYLGLTTSVPDSVTDSYKMIASKTNHPLSSQVKEEINKRIEQGFTYSDLLWSRDQILESCGNQEQSEPFIERIKSTAIIGFFSLEPSYASSSIQVQNARFDLDCSIEEKAE